MSMIANFIELFDRNAYCTAKRDIWPEKTCIFGHRIIKVSEADVESTLFIDPVVCDYLKILGHSGDVIFRSEFMLIDEEGAISYWSPTRADIFADDWVIHDHTDYINAAHKSKEDESCVIDVN